MGRVVIAGDAVFVEENMKGDAAQLLEFIPIGRYINYFDMWNSFKEIKKRADLVLPGHDMRVFRQISYPYNMKKFNPTIEAMLPWKYL